MTCPRFASTHSNYSFPSNKFDTPEEIRNFVWKKLDLNTHSITFYTLDIGASRVFVRPGIIDCSGDLYEDAEFSDIVAGYEGEKTIHVYGVMSWMIGDGESDHADYEDCELLESILNDSGSVMADFLDEYADCLCSIDDFDIDNPTYTEYETGAAEACPNCGGENEYKGWDVARDGYIARCVHCGAEMFLCDECMHADDNPGMDCDWHEENGNGVCRRGTIENE